MGITTVVAVCAVIAFVIAQKPSQPRSQSQAAARSQHTATAHGSTKPRSTPTPKVAADIAPNIPAGAPTGDGLSGQVLNANGLCLSGVAASASVVLATCTASEIQQEWTQANGKLMLNGLCLGTGPKAKPGSVAGLYTCNGSATQKWTVASDQTIQNEGSGLCLGKEASGTGAWATSCQPGSQAQTWITATAAADPSGFAMPVGNMPGWRQVFTDNFTENVPIGDFPGAVSNQWGDYLDGWKDTTHHGEYYPSKVVSIHNGVMDMYLHTENGIHMVAAPYPRIPAATGPDGGETYGVYEVRFKVQPVVGYKTAWLLWPDSNSQELGGEIDFPESNLWQNGIKAFSHHPGPNSQKSQDQYVTNATYNTWHTATIVWTAKQILFLLDGRLIGDSTNPAAIPHTPMHWVLQTETHTGEGPLNNTAAGHVDIDWVSVWYEQGN